MKSINTINSHKTILKATSIFGMIQVLKMIISIIGNKFVAFFLGPIGIGTVGLLTNVLNIISSICCKLSFDSCIELIFESSGLFCNLLPYVFQTLLKQLFLIQILQETLNPQYRWRKRPTQPLLLYPFLNP